ncbi:GDP-fucose protein O-fucosyltransferase [Dillenia turbinata]|uniref:GDP-fucose protein O-fucosyltransferase n=1 Tax=Dillenia turbinata TaxID=194707 RepID=A0AAN8W7F8_9MAGN
MNALNLSKSKFKRKPINGSTILIAIFFSLFIFISFKFAPKSFLPISPSKTLTLEFPQCSSRTLDQKFLFYAPHSGFSNQLSELRNAIVMAAILNRTLIVPPILDHHAIVLGKCPKFKVTSPPSELRNAVFHYAISLIRNHRQVSFAYVSMADVVDLSSVVSSSLLRVIDFRVFLYLWCGVNADFTCFKDLDIRSSLFDTIWQCGSVLSGFLGSLDRCLFAVEEDCRTTVWTYQENNKDGVLDAFQPDEDLREKRKISYVRRRRDVCKAFGPNSVAELAMVLAFGSLFTAPYKWSELYIDIHEAPKDQRIQSVMEKIKYLPFVPEIISAGKEFAVKTIKAPFLCAQIRLLDGQFKKHQEATFLRLKEKVELLRQKGPLPIPIFVMTDLAESNWSGTYLDELVSSDSVKLHYLKQEDELVLKTAKKVMAAGHSMRFGSVPDKFSKMKDCASLMLPDMLLFLEETICSCASLGFVGTAGSTIAENIELMREFGTC